MSTTTSNGRPPDDLDIAIERAKHGDPGALSFLYTRYSAEVYRYAHRITNDPHDAEDVTQTTFAKLMHAIAGYEQREVPFSSWLLGVTRHTALDHVGRARRQVPCESVPSDGDPDAPPALDRNDCLGSALRSLPHEQRAVVILRHVLGLSPAEIARHLGKTEASVHGLHHRGRWALQSELREQGLAPAIASAA